MSTYVFRCVVFFISSFIFQIFRDKVPEGEFDSDDDGRRADDDGHRADDDGRRADVDGHRADDNGCRADKEHM